MSKVYLAGPIMGLTYKEARYGWREEFAEALTDFNADVTVLSPMRHEGHLAEIQGPLTATGDVNHIFSHPKMIVAKDFLDITRSDIVVANFSGATEISRGTLVELGYAFAGGKTIVVIMNTGNIHDHPFVREVAHVVTPSIKEAAMIVASLLSEGI